MKRKLLAAAAAIAPAAAHAGKGDWEQALSFVLLAGAAISIYLVPSIVATTRRHRNADAIIVLNFFLGWTFLGWIGALVWATTANVHPPRQPLPPAAPEGQGGPPQRSEPPKYEQCPFCLELVRAGAQRCRHCHADLSTKPTA